VSNGSGGVDVGGFSASLTLPSVANVWANQDALVNLSRSPDLTIALNPAGDSVALGIVGNSVDSSIGQNAIINCAVPPGATSFTIPGLRPLRSSGQRLVVRLGRVRTAFLGVAAAPANPNRIQARGVDSGGFYWLQLFVKNVNLQ